jgi:hypothetical protein
VDPNRKGRRGRKGNLIFLKFTPWWINNIYLNFAFFALSAVNQLFFSRAKDPIFQIPTLTEGAS